MNENEEFDLTFEARSLKITPDNAGVRADKALAAWSFEGGAGLSRARLQTLIEQGHVLCNGNPIKAAQKFSVGDEILLHIPPLEAAAIEPENIPLAIVYEDDDILILNKPAGLVVHPGAGHWSGTLVNALLYHCRGSLSGIGGVVRPGIVHRLDKDTSGLMVVAKHDEAHQHLSAQLAERSLTRLYYALVLGNPLPIKGAVRRPIGRHRHHRQKMSVMSDAPRDAVTHYHALRAFGGACSLVECRLETGRTHQIRVHMEALGHPLIGDPLYGPQPTALKSKLKKENYTNDTIDKIMNFPRQFLHAETLMLIHPITEEELSFSAPLPPDLEEILAALEGGVA